MLQLSTGNNRPAWMINVLALILTLGCTAGLAVVFKNGCPSRTVMVGIVAILTLAPLLLRWQWGWMVLFCFFPFVNFIRRVYFLFEQNQDTVMFNDAFVVLPDAVLAVAIAGYLLSIRRRGKDSAPMDDRAIRTPMVLMIGLSIVEIFNPVMGSVVAGVNGFRQFTLYLLLYFLTQAVIRERKQIHRWMLSGLIIGAVTGAYGAYQYIFDFPIYDEIWASLYRAENQTIGDQMRAFSTFSFTSTFSHYMMAVLCVGLVALRMKGIGLFTRLLTPFYLACMLLGLAVTFVRSSYLGIIIAGLVALILSGKPSGRMQRFLAVTCLTAVLVAMMPHSNERINDARNDSRDDVGTSQLVTNRLMTLAEPTKAGSMQNRYFAWNNVLQRSLVYPIGLGIGAGASSRFTGDFVTAAGAYTESQYFSILAELGWPGTLLYFWLIIAGFLTSIRVHDALKDSDLKLIARMCIMIQVCLSITGIAGGAVLYVLPGAAFYWTALGMVTVLPRIEREEAEKKAIAAGAPS